MLMPCVLSLPRAQGKFVDAVVPAQQMATRSRAVWVVEVEKFHAKAPFVKKSLPREQVKRRGEKKRENGKDKWSTEKKRTT